MIGVIGFFVLWVSILFPIVMSENMGMFTFIPSFLTIMGISLGLGLMSCGWQGVLSGFKGLRYLFVVPEATKDGVVLIEVYRRLIIYTYVASSIATLMGGIIMLTHYNETVRFCSGLAVLLLNPLYAVLISECFWRPASHRMSMKKVLE